MAKKTEAILHWIQRSSHRCDAKRYWGTLPSSACFNSNKRTTNGQPGITGKPVTFADKEGTRDPPAKLAYLPHALQHLSAARGVQPSESIVCHTCYKWGHLLMQWNLSVMDLGTIFPNYHDLTYIKKYCVPLKSFVDVSELLSAVRSYITRRLSKEICRKVDRVPGQKQEEERKVNPLKFSSAVL